MILFQIFINIINSFPSPYFIQTVVLKNKSFLRKMVTEAAVKRNSLAVENLFSDRVKTFDLQINLRTTSSDT